MDIKWWSDLKNDTRRLIIALGSAIVTLCSVVGYQEVEKKRLQSDLTQANKEKEDAIKEKGVIAVNAAKEMTAMVQQLYKEQKDKNAKHDSITEVWREEVQKQSLITRDNAASTDRTKQTLQQINKVKSK